MPGARVQARGRGRRPAARPLDASFRAGGWWFGGRFRAWLWPADWRSGRIGDFSRDDAIAIGELEALALLVALRDLATLCAGGLGCPGRRLVCHIDNISSLSLIAVPDFTRKTLWLLALAQRNQQQSRQLKSRLTEVLESACVWLVPA
eukprot:COSAG03_NODE_1385_length_4188_cov_90.131817_4_plen_148_part_00